MGVVDIIDPPPVRVLREEFDERHERGDFVIKFDDMFTHPLVTDSYGITREALEEVGKRGVSGEGSFGGKYGWG